MPTGTPTTAPAATATLDCQATAAAIWRLVNPMVFSSARSQQRRRTEAISVSPSAAIAPAARAAPRYPGVSPMDR